MTNRDIYLVGPAIGIAVCAVWAVCKVVFGECSYSLVAVNAIYGTVLVAAAYQDAKTGIIANEWSLALALCGVMQEVQLVTELRAEQAIDELLQRMIAAMMLVCLLLLAVKIGKIFGVRGDLGGGDIKLLGALGFCCGLSTTLLVVLMSCGELLAVWLIRGGTQGLLQRVELCGLAQSTWKNRNIKVHDVPSEYPFAPFIAVSYLLMGLVL